MEPNYSKFTKQKKKNRTGNKGHVGAEGILQSKQLLIELNTTFTVAESSHPAADVMFTIQDKFKKGLNKEQ